jgi:hypothetical protein
MLLAVLDWMLKPFDRRRLWLTAPLALGGLAIIVGGLLLVPFVSGYGPLQSVRISSIVKCHANIDAYVAATQSGKFFVAIVPSVGGAPSAGSSQVRAFSSWASSSATEREKKSHYGWQIVQHDSGCATAKYLVETHNGVTVRLKGVFIGNAFQTQESGGAAINPAFGNKRFVNLGFWEYTSPIGKRDFKSSPDFATAIVKDRYEPPKGLREKVRVYDVHVPYTYAVLPPSAAVPLGTPLEKIVSRKPIRQAVGITAAIFEVDCPACKGRGHLGNQLAVGIRHGRDEQELELGHRNKSSNNKIFASSGETWRASAIASLHGERHQFGEHLISAGPLIDEAGEIDHEAHRVDGFSWERRQWVDKEQGITIFASLLLGLGTTLWTELLIVFLHSLAAREKFEPKGNRKMPLKKDRYPSNSKPRPTNTNLAARLRRSKNR